MKVRGKREIPKKTRLTAASSGTTPTCENPGVTRPGIELDESQATSAETGSGVMVRPANPRNSWANRIVSLWSKQMAQATVFRSDFPEFSVVSSDIPQLFWGAAIICIAGVRFMRSGQHRCSSRPGVCEHVPPLTFKGGMAGQASHMLRFGGLSFKTRRLTMAGHTHLHVFSFQWPGDERRRSQCYVGLDRGRCLLFSAPFTGQEGRGCSTTVFRKVLLQSRSCPGSKFEVKHYDGNTARLARRSDEALGVRVSVARIAPSLLDQLMRVKRGESGAAPECQGGGNGRSRENPPTSGIVQHDPHLQKNRERPGRNKSGNPGVFPTPGIFISFKGMKANFQHGGGRLRRSEPPVQICVPRFPCPRVHQILLLLADAAVDRRHKIDVKHMYTEVGIAIGSQFIRHALDDSEPVADLQGNK
ncbi:hypothetical protein PR048_031687 [Dryococelus australis]|uniref:Uncharacterized protein n=1 Tax=Dryococelus australis TaxID=614101 RepID=A0ABQ9G8S8_9NEOP|nr:hypothetical protein PR048_031687 [Dryococelus australis]